MDDQLVIKCWQPWPNNLTTCSLSVHLGRHCMSSNLIQKSTPESGLNENLLCGELAGFSFDPGNTVSENHY